MRRALMFTLDDGPEVELGHEPCCSEVLQIKVKDRYVVAYNVLDDDGFSCNPLKDYDGNGQLFTNGRERAITDDLSAALRHLGLSDMSSRGNEYDLDCDGVDELAASLIRNEVCGDEDFSTWCKENFEQDGDTTEEDIFKQIDWGAYSTVLPNWLSSKFEEARVKAWKLLYEEGKIGTYLAVPVYYSASVHGPGTCQIYTTDIDSCNAVWVPGKCEISNMHFTAGMSYLEMLAVAANYADSCLNEYEKWCNGEVYGCVVKVFNNEGEQIGEDSCWGFIGWEWAKQALQDDFFDPAVRAEMLREEETAV